MDGSMRKMPSVKRLLKKLAEISCIHAKYCVSLKKQCQKMLWSQPILAILIRSPTVICVLKSHAVSLPQ